MNFLSKLNAGFYRLETYFYRSFYQWKHAHPWHQNYVSGDGFGALAQVRIDKEKQLDFHALERLESGILVYINGWLMPKVISTWKNSPIFFNLITHNSDWGPDEKAKSW